MEGLIDTLARSPSPATELPVLKKISWPHSELQCSHGKLIIKLMKTTNEIYHLPEKFIPTQATLPLECHFDLQHYTEQGSLKLCYLYSSFYVQKSFL